MKTRMWLMPIALAALIPLVPSTASAYELVCSGGWIGVECADGHSFNCESGGVPIDCTNDHGQIGCEGHGGVAYIGPGNGLDMILDYVGVFILGNPDVEAPDDAPKAEVSYFLECRDGWSTSCEDSDRCGEIAASEEQICGAEGVAESVYFIAPRWAR